MVASLGDRQNGRDRAKKKNMLFSRTELRRKPDMVVQMTDKSRGQRKRGSYSVGQKKRSRHVNTIYHSLRGSEQTKKRLSLSQILSQKTFFLPPLLVFLIFFFR